MGQWAWGWDAIAAIGQVIGALATAVAVWIALRQLIFQHKTKTLILIENIGGIISKENESLNTYAVSIVNIGILPIKIVSGGIMYSNVYLQYCIKELSDTLPKEITTANSVKIVFDSAVLLRQLEANKGSIKKNTRVAAYFKDSSGKYYYKKYFNYFIFLKRLHSQAKSD